MGLIALAHYYRTSQLIPHFNNEIKYYYYCRFCNWAAVEMGFDQTVQIGCGNTDQNCLDAVALRWCNHTIQLDIILAKNGM